MGKAAGYLLRQWIGRDSLRQGNLNGFQFYTHLSLYPGICARQSLLKRYLRLPAKHLSQSGVIGIPSAHSLRTRYMLFSDTTTCDFSDHFAEWVNSKQPILP